MTIKTKTLIACSRCILENDEIASMCQEHGDKVNTISKMILEVIASETGGWIETER